MDISDRKLTSLQVWHFFSTNIKFVITTNMMFNQNVYKDDSNVILKAFMFTQIENFRKLESK